MKPDTVTVGLVQMAMSVDKAPNIAAARRGIAAAATRGAQIVCLPELFASQYFCQVQDPKFFDLAEPVPGPTSSSIAAVAKEHGVVVVTPVFEKRASGVYHNSLVVHGAAGESLGLYRKMHIPDDPLFFEKYYFTPGDLGFMTVRTPVAAIGPLICWDQWYPEAARLTTLQGAQILVYPTAIGWHPKEKAEFGAAQLSAWQTMQRSHAIANGVFVVAVNRVGHEGPKEGGLDFWGHSLRGRSLRRRARGSGRRRRGPGGRARPVAPGRRTAQLALPARPADRRLRRHHFARHRRTSEVVPARTTNTPRALGYRMPAEWEPHAATWLAWPHEPSDWPGKFAAVPWVFAEIARHLQDGERIRLIVRNAVEKAAATSVLKRSGVSLRRVDFVTAATNRSWTRDSLPIGIVRGRGTQAGTSRREMALQWLGPLPQLPG